MELRCVLYVSSAVRHLTEADMEYLLEGARARNLEAGVTGILLHRNGNFMQYIEGPVDGIDRIYRIIRQSPLHRDIVEIVSESSLVRLFPLWTMAYQRFGFQSFSDPDQYAMALHPDLASSPIIMLLNNFRNGPGLSGRE